MKVKHYALQEIAIMLVLLLIAAQGAWADLRRKDNSVCSPTIKFKLPNDWVRAYVVIGGSAHAMPTPDANGWSTVSLADTKLVGTNHDDAFYINGVNDNTCQQGKCVLPKQFSVKVNDGRAVGFTCSTFENGKKGWQDGDTVWVQDHPDTKKSGQTYITYTKPNVKDFYIFLPQNETWKSATPVINEDGKDREMYNDSEHCGWYYRRYIDEPLPTSAIIHRDDDETMSDAIGTNGAWETNSDAPEAIAMSAMFMLFDDADAIYFVADEDEAMKLGNTTAKGWDITRPVTEGKCGYDLAALIYDTDASLHGAFTCNPDWRDGQSTAEAHANACYTPSAKYQVVSSATGEVPCIGVTKGMVESTLQVDPTTKKKYMKLTTVGKKCFGSTPDEAFKAMFTATPGVNEEYCFNLPFTQASDGKFEFESDYYQSPGATVPGGFYPAEKSPDPSMMLSDALPAAENKRKAEGPVYFCADDPNAGSTTPLGLRTIHPTEGVPMSDLICNGPGWDGGVDCDGYFQGGSEFELGKSTIAGQISKKLGVTWGGDGWAWSCDYMGAPDGWPRYAEGTESKATASSSTYRWTSGKSDSDVLTTAGRNQHFCFESHANFRFKHGLKFSFRGDDDIWVFIDRKLAVDLGGTHLAAPGYVDLDKFMPDAEVGTSYEIDIYFCDRRTTMSNVHIKTNMFIEQKTGIEATGKQDKEDYRLNGNNKFKLCYKESGGGSCGAAMGGGGDQEWCGEEIIKAGKTVNYVLSKDQLGAGDAVISEAEFAANPVQANGGINVTDPTAPIINEEKLKDSGIPSGTYYLVIKIGTDTRPIKITIKGSVGVANREAVLVDTTGNQSLPISYKSQAMASKANDDGSIDIKQLVPLYIASMADPCNGTDCGKPLELQYSAGESYSLESSSAKVVFYEYKNGKLTPFAPSAGRKIGAGGYDTVYVTIPFDDMEAASEKVSINVKGSTRKAEITFFVPQLAFVDSDSTLNKITSDPDTYIRLQGSPYEFFVVALNADNSVCTDCNFKLDKGSKTSNGVEIIDGGEVVNGRATIWIRSTIAYEKCDGCRGAATLHVVGPAAGFMQVSYTNMQFQEPPVPIPQFADIFDVHGEKPAVEMNVPVPYFSMETEYLDGIADSIAIYYHKNFVNDKDSLPDQVVIFWDEDAADSVLFTKEEVLAGSYCGKQYTGLDTACLNVITLGGKKLSNSIKTAGAGKVKSRATYKAKGKTQSADYESPIYDRVAPVIVSARATTDTTSGKNAQLKIVSSEYPKKTDKASAVGDEVFSFYINTGKESKFAPGITSLSQLNEKLDSAQTLIYSQKNTFPQAGDYIHYRSADDGIGYVSDVSDYASVATVDSLRKSVGAALGNTSTIDWNIAPGYNSDPKVRLPSPWVLVSGDVNAYAVRLIPEAKATLPLSPSDAANLPIADVFTFDANKDEGDFASVIKNGEGEFSKYHFTPHGWYVKSDMGALIESKEEYAGVKKDEVYFEYEIEFFTNLGSYVARNTGRIYCDDKKNQTEFGKQYFDGKNCVEVRRNFYVVWNMKSDENRLVGAGAYISRLKSFVNLAGFGKKNKNDKTEMWGVRHGNGALVIDAGK